MPFGDDSAHEVLIVGTAQLVVIPEASSWHWVTVFPAKFGTKLFFFFFFFFFFFLVGLGG